MRRIILPIKTKGIFTDITEKLEEFCIYEGDGDSMLNIFVKHTTCGIRILEHEKLLLADYEKALHEFAPKEGYYAHNIIDARDVPETERINGHSHIRALFFPASCNIPVENGKMMLGKWQRIFLVELDPAREREVIFTIF